MRSFDCFKIKNEELQTNDGDSDDMIDCLIGGKKLVMLIDSGCKINIVKDTNLELFFKNKAVIWDVNKNTTDILRPYGTTKPLTVKMRFVTTISSPNDKEIIASFYVVENGDISIVGKNTAKQLGILKLGINVNMVNKITAFPKIKNVCVKLSIDPYVKPVQQPLRTIPIAVEKQVEDKLNVALQLDIIEPVSGPSA